MLSASDEAYVRDVLKVFYPTLPPSRVSDAMADFAAKLHYEAVKTSKRLDLVPRPAATPPGVAWLLLQAVQMVWRTQMKGAKWYHAAVVTIARNFRSEYELLRMGID